MDEFIDFLSTQNDLSKIKPSYNNVRIVPNIFNNANFNELGGIYCYQNHLYASVIWKANFITFINRQNLDVVSFNFGGCLMAAFTLNNKKYACHIHTDANPNNDRMNDWATFCKANQPSDIQIFKPDGNLITNYNATEVWGVITKEGNCYSIGVEYTPSGSLKLKVVKKMNSYRGIKAQNALVKKCRYYYI